MFLPLGIFSFLMVVTTSITPITKTDYQAALNLSLLFYEAQRSGALPPTNRVPWRGDSALLDHGLKGEDLSGGYYDAGDFVKFSFTMAFTTTVLTWGMLSFPEAYQKTGQFHHGLEAIQWATDYFLKCHVSPNEFYGQVGDFSLDHSFWGRPEDMNMSRPAYKIDVEYPGSDLAGEVAAALAAASLLFRPWNGTYSGVLLKHAQQLYRFGCEYRGLYHDAIPGAKAYYESTGYGDELTWAAVWLYRATNETHFLDEAENFYAKFRLNDRPNEFFYNKKVAGIQLLLGEDTRKMEYISAIKNFCDYTINEQIRTPLGLVFIEKSGTLSHASNLAFICLQAGIKLNISPKDYTTFAKEQIDYILGGSTKKRSFLVGYGTNFPVKAHHSASSCPDRPSPCDWKQFHSLKPNPQTLYGALVSGPDQNDHYEDDREEFLYNDVTLDFNAGFQSALAGLLHHLYTQ